MTRDTESQAEEFQRAVTRAVRWIGDYFDHPERYPVLSRVQPGSVRSSFPQRAPEAGRPLDELLDDVFEKIVPGVTHWNHPSFFAYFSITGSYPGILGELIAAALNVNGMLWRTSPALTELETLSLDYLADLAGLGTGFFGQILDTASTSSLVALAAAREAVEGLDVKRKGLAGRGDIAPLVLYASSEAHSSIDKAAIVLGIGTDNIRHIPTDHAFRMDPVALDDAIAADRRKGLRPFCVVATVGTTSTVSVDPVSAVADVCARRGLWLHVDAAYAWAAAILPEKRWVVDGCQRADSIVINPHKWLFTPIDLSVLLCRHRAGLKNVFSLVPAYLQSDDGTEQPNLMDYGFQLGRRFRALKLWMVLNYYGVDGLREKIRSHIALAGGFERWALDHPDFEVMAPVEFSVVCFRAVPAGGGQDPAALDHFNERLLDAVNRSGEAFLSHTRIEGKYALRCAIGNIRTEEKHIEALQRLLEGECERLKGDTR